MTDAPSAVARHRAFEQIWGNPPGWGRLAAVNHTTVGLRFILTALAFFLVGGVLAMMMRAQLAAAGNGFLDSETYNQIFTMHGTVMMFLFAIPMLEGFAIYLLPKMLGARDLAYPRLGAFAYWCYLFGGLILLGGLAAGVAPRSGWFMYTPLSGSTYSPGVNADVWLIGVTFSEISALCGGVELAASILRVRAAGMRLSRMPLFAWYMLVTALMILVGFPPLILGSILLEVERAFGWPFFDVARGGDPLLWQHLFWMFGHPEVYIIFLPAAGLVSTMIPTFAQRPIVGRVWILASVLAVGVLSFALWGHHMSTAGIAGHAAAFFSIASMLIAVPTAVQFFAWLATLYAGTPALRLPMLYLAGFLAIFVLGGLTGVMLALLPFNWQAHDTHFVVAHLHYVLIGGMVFPLLAAAYYWMPHVTGRMPSPVLGRWAFWLIFAGFNLTFLPMHLTGMLGMPRRVHAYAADSGWEGLNLVSSLGGFLQAAGVGLFILDIFLHARVGRRAPPNPWRASGIEWAMATPSPSYNFAAIPNLAAMPEPGIEDPLWSRPDLGAELAGGQGYLADPGRGHRETLSVELLSGQPRHIIILPGSTWLPLWSALALLLCCLCLLFKVYAALPAPAVLAAVLLACWAWRSGLRADPRPLDAGNGLWLLPHAVARHPPGWSGTKLTLVADAALFGSLLFGYAYLWTVAPQWPPPVYISRTVPAPLACGAALTVALAAVMVARRPRMLARPRLCAGWLAVAALAGLAALWSWAHIGMDAVPPPTSHAYAAVSLALVCYAAFHVAIGVILAGLGALRCLAGYVSPLRSLDVRISGLWWIYTWVTGLIALAVLYGPPQPIWAGAAIC
ncbi:MAG: cytochrome c oxidase subunit I [Pigmentiphaga sp.]|uniref:cytochrome c oxidase subunit I n=1 Tax=Pigmentiphaga sp. TaxID=1977564 RepID=UPI0029A20501|nr:cytochrome c oxidase subunit I [Pigmentiphaga sp.]MDX3904209.1 cytochrome c oxidase subunit I [Pigmentiphaga sp.]